MDKLALSIIQLKEKYPNRPIIIAVVGRARSGKTTFAKKLAQTLKKKHAYNIVYHGDWHLRNTSKERKKWIYEAFCDNVKKYIEKINTLNCLFFACIFFHIIERVNFGIFFFEKISTSLSSKL